MPLGGAKSSLIKVCFEVSPERVECVRWTEWVRKRVPNTWSSCAERAGTENNHRLGLAMINLYTNSEVSMFTHNEYMKCNAKCINLGGFGGYGDPRSPAMSTFDVAHTTSYSTLIETMRLSYIPLSCSEFLGHLLRDDLINPVKMSVHPYVRTYVHNQTQCSNKPNSGIC